MKLDEWFCLTSIYNLLIPCFGVSSCQIMPLSCTCHTLIHYLPWQGIPPFLWNIKTSLLTTVGPVLWCSQYLVNLPRSTQDKTNHLTGTAVWFPKSPRNPTNVPAQKQTTNTNTALICPFTVQYSFGFKSSLCVFVYWFDLLQSTGRYPQVYAALWTLLHCCL